MPGTILFQSQSTGFRLSGKREISSWIKEAISAEGYLCGEISIVLCSDDYLLEINRQHLNHDYYTDIITFQYSDNQSVSGDLLISIDRVKENAERFKASTKDELHRVIIHGVLHLCGYKDKKKKDQQQMRLRENHYLQKRKF